MANSQSKALVPTVLAAAGIVVGMFGPIVRAGVDVEGIGEIGSVQPTYYGWFTNYGNILLALCAIALVLAIRGMGKWLWVCALGVWATLLWPVIRGATTPKDESLMGQLKGLVADEVSKYANEHAAVLTDLTSLSWGGFALLGGALIMIWAALKGR